MNKVSEADMYIFIAKETVTIVKQVYEQFGSTPEMIWTILYDMDKQRKISLCAGNSLMLEKELPDDWETRKVAITLTYARKQR